METSQSCQSFGTNLNGLVSGLGVEHDDRVGIEVFPLARADREVGSRVAAGDVEMSGLRIERV